MSEPTTQPKVPQGKSNKMTWPATQPGLANKKQNKKLLGPNDKFPRSTQGVNCRRARIELSDNRLRVPVGSSLDLTFAPAQTLGWLISSRGGPKKYALLIKVNHFRLTGNWCVTGPTLSLYFYTKWSDFGFFVSITEHVCLGWLPQIAMSLTWENNVSRSPHPLPEDPKWRYFTGFILKSWHTPSSDTSRSKCWNGSLRINNSVDFWYRIISLRTTVTERYRRLLTRIRLLLEGIPVVGLLSAGSRHVVSCWFQIDCDQKPPPPKWYHH